ncbi:MAG: response regulator [Treponema sp.]|nr:response regulator [Treponema sp.]
MALTILIVDDSKIMRNTMKSVFAKMKITCEFIEADDGEEALTQLDTNTIGLILLDWNMPKLTGLDFLKRVRTTEKYKTMPIIMVTSKTSRADVIEAIQNGATDYITKPINVELFIEKLIRLPLFKGYQID